VAVPASARNEDIGRALASSARQGSVHGRVTSGRSLDEAPQQRTMLDFPDPALGLRHDAATEPLAASAVLSPPLSPSISLGAPNRSHALN